MNFIHFVHFLMEKNNIIFKWLLSFLLILYWFFMNFTSATSQQWRNILNELRKEWRQDEEIKTMMKDLWLDTSGYFPNSSILSWTTYTNNINYNTKNTSQQWRNTLNELRKEWRQDEEIKTMMKDLWLDTSGYFPDSSSYIWNTEWTYTSRSCKVYNIEYISNLWAYTSPNLNKKEYFVSIDYFKRYVDSKNPQKYNCPSNGWRINTFYDDQSNSTDHYTAPNWKIYFITNQNWFYSSSELNNNKSFWTINELKNYIKNRNPLIYMGNSSTQNNYTNNNNANETVAKMRSEIFN